MTKILVVDDDPDFLRITQTILQSRDYQVITATNGERALAAMRREKPNLVLLDIMMSYILDGLDVGREMAEDPELKDIDRRSSAGGRALRRVHTRRRLAPQTRRP